MVKGHVFSSNPLKEAIHWSCWLDRHPLVMNVALSVLSLGGRAVGVEAHDQHTSDAADRVIGIRAKRGKIMCMEAKKERSPQPSGRIAC